MATNSTIVNSAVGATNTVISTTTTIASAIMTATATATQNAAAAKPTSVGSSNLFPAVCIVSGIMFVAAILFYIYSTRNDDSNGGELKIKKQSYGSSGNNSAKFDIRVDKPSNNNNKFNAPGDKTFLNPYEERSIISPTSLYSDTNNLLDVNRNNMNFNAGADYNNLPPMPKKKQHYPNPLYEHSTVTRPVMNPMGGDITDEDIPQNLNILTQEEVQLLKMKKKFPNQNNLNNELYNYNSLGRGGNGVNQMNMNQYTGMSSSSNNNNRGNHGRSPSQPGMKKIPDMTAVAPFNFMGSDNNNRANQLFKEDSDGDSSFYNDTFIRNLGDDIKIETKKIEYESDEDVINKIKIKRINQ